LTISTIRYRPEIDGLRALAVVPVILFHAYPDYLTGGYAGVDVFFVISGFLITLMIIKEHKAGVFKLRKFWIRRIQRIVPPLLFMIASVIILSFLLLYKNEHVQVGKEALSALFSVANIYLWTLTRNYWGPQPEHSYFLHTWSLSLEEQFYFFFPLILIFILKKAPYLLLRLAFLITFLVYLVFALIASDHPNASFYLLPARCWELAMGATLAIYNTSSNKPFDKLSHKIISLSSWIGISMIFLAYFLLDGKDGLGYGLILPTLGAAIFIFFVSQRFVLRFEICVL